MKVGAERRKVLILGALLLVAAVVFYMNVLSTPGDTDYGAGSSPAPGAGAAAPAVAAARPEAGGTPGANAMRRGRTSTEFRPSMRPRRGEARPDPGSIDPTLRLDVLAKLQDVNVEGARRSIFDFSQPAAPPDSVKIAAAKPPVPNPIVPVQPPTPAEPVNTEPAKPAPPPIPLKFYGYVNPAAGQVRRAFFTEGEEIHVVNEGDVVKRRYKIVRIGVNSVIVEDMQFGSQQTLPLEEQQQG
ncbi:MAG TPA: hypothetical protein VES20_13945 [Bryobacteraceae bacterium]|nr:hypothetical protein [Bryobacteraceae bacterium]